MQRKYRIHSFDCNIYEIGGPYVAKEEARWAYEHEVVLEPGLYHAPTNWEAASSVSATSMEEAGESAEHWHRKFTKVASAQAENDERDSVDDVRVVH